MNTSICKNRHMHVSAYASMNHNIHMQSVNLNVWGGGEESKITMCEGEAVHKAYKAYKAYE